MSVEGMWCFVTGEVGEDYMASGGVIVLDTQRIYGGDSAMAYVGRYEVDNGRVTGAVESFLYNPAYQGQNDVFDELAGDPRETQFDVSMNDDGFLVGSLIRKDVKLPIIMQKLRELP